MEPKWAGVVLITEAVVFVYLFIDLLTDLLWKVLQQILPQTQVGQVGEVADASG